MRLPHLLIPVVLYLPIRLLLDSLWQYTGMGTSRPSIGWMLALVAWVTTILAAWPVARFLRVPPLMIFAGPCPACGLRPAGWWKVSHAGDDKKLVLLCGNCGQAVDVWLVRPPQRNLISAIVPSYVLRHPRFFGVWRRL